MNCKKRLLLLSLFILHSLLASGQSLYQTVRGYVYDVDNKMPLIGAQVVIRDSNPLQGSVTDTNGAFKLENVAVGRITLDISYIGYQPMSIPDILVISGKETVLTFSLQEAISQLNELVITASGDKGEALGEMALTSVRSISADETNRFAGGFNDPARILSNFAGVNNSQDGSADIIVRGNSPKYLQWRLEGVQITSPTHFADPSGLGSNGISALNNNILSTSDFYTGAFPAEFGDALSGVYDVRLRNGNNEQFEAILGAGIVGTDATLEGPLKKGYQGSYLANYRFTTITLADKLGMLPDFGGIPSFQDGAFKINLPTKRFGSFSLYSLSGSSQIKFEDVDAGTWETPGNNGMQDNIEEDFSKKAFLINTGLNHMLHLGSNSYLQSSVAFSSEGLTDEVTEKVIENESVLETRENYKSNIRNQTYRINLIFNSKLNSKNTLQAGAFYTYKDQSFDISHLDNDANTRIALVNFKEGIASFRGFASIKHRFTEDFTVVAGLHTMNVIFNQKNTLEPRIAFQWKAAPAHAFNLGYGMHSTMESIHNYFTKVSDQDGNVTEPNKDLDLLKTHHYVLGYENKSFRNFRIKADAYYQNLYDLPVENNVLSSYATLNENLDLRFVELVNKGTGTNYGVELTLERFFSKNYYFLINTSVFDSKYKALDGVERNTAFNSNYLVNLLWGKEFVKLGKQQNKSFGINTKAFIGGGRRIIPLLRDANGELAVDPANNQFYDYQKAYEYYLDDIYTITLSLSYKWSKAKRTNELFLNIDNVTNNKPRLSEYYDSKKTNGIGYLTPIGSFPNLMYRLYF